MFFLNLVNVITIILNNWSIFSRLSADSVWFIICYDFEFDESWIWRRLNSNNKLKAFFWANFLKQQKNYFDLTYQLIKHREIIDAFFSYFDIFKE